MRPVSLWRYARATAGAIAILAILGAPSAAQKGPTGTLRLPQNAVALEGLPDVRIDVTRDTTSRRELDRAEAARSRLAVRITDERFYWTSHGDRPLTLTSSGDFTYLWSAEPGRYVRIRRLDDRFTYVEHVDTEFGSVTYWGELRVVIGR